jgi:hypothetical protein
MAPGGGGKRKENDRVNNIEIHCITLSFIDYLKFML